MMNPNIIALLRLRNGLKPEDDISSLPDPTQQGVTPDALRGGTNHGLTADELAASSPIIKGLKPDNAGPGPAPTPDAVVKQSGPPDRFKIIDEAYDHPSPALDAYRTHVMNPPARVKPKWWQVGLDAAAAGITGYSKNSAEEGIKVGQQLLEHPHAQSVADWRLKEEGLKGAATVEEKEGDSREKKAGAYERAIHDQSEEGLSQGRLNVSRQELDRRFQHDYNTAQTAQDKNRIQAQYNSDRIKLGFANAGTAAGRVANESRRNDLLAGEYQSRDWKRHQPPQSRQNPTNVARAEWDSTNEVLAEHPEWRKAFGQERSDAQGNKSVELGSLPDDADPNTKLEWVRMKNEIRKRARKRLAGTTSNDIALPVNLPQDEEQDPFTDEEQ